MKEIAIDSIELVVTSPPRFQIGFNFVFTTVFANILFQTPDANEYKTNLGYFITEQEPFADKFI